MNKKQMRNWIGVLIIIALAVILWTTLSNAGEPEYDHIIDLSTMPYNQLNPDTVRNDFKRNHLINCKFEGNLIYYGSVSEGVKIDTCSNSYQKYLNL